MLASLLCNTPRAAPVRWYILPGGERTQDKDYALAVLQRLRNELWDAGDVPTPREKPKRKAFRFLAPAGIASERTFEDEDDLLAVLVALWR